MIRALLPCLIVCLAPLHANAQQRLHLTVQAGAGDNVRAWAMTPIQVVLQNGDEAYDGRLVTSFTAMSRANTVATRQIELAPRAAKRVTSYLPVPSGADTVHVAYEIDRGALGWTEVASTTQRLNHVNPEIPSFGAVGAFPRGIPDDTHPDGERRLYTRFFLPQAQIPPRHDGLEMFDVLFISPTPEAPFESAQVQALSDWTLRGGLLIVDASERTEAFRLGPFAELMPFVPQTTDQAEISLFGAELLLARGDVRSGTVILRSNNMPLVIAQPYGLGMIVAFAFPLDSPAFLEWPRREAFWNELLGGLIQLNAQPQYNHLTGGYFGGITGDIASRMAEEVTEAPSTGMRLGLVLLLTLLYALAAGPGDYYLVRKLGRPKLTWLTFPLIVAAFTIIAAVGARYWIGGDWEIRHLRRTIVFPELERAIHHDLTGVFVPNADTYLISDARGVPLRHIGDMYGLGDRLRIDEDANTLQQRIPIWTHRAYVSSITSNDYPRIDIKFIDENSLRITNRSDFPVRPVNMIYGQYTSGFIGQTAIQPNETVDSDLRADWKSTFTGILREGVGLPGQTPFPREFNITESVRRGANFVVFEARGPGSDLEVGGEPTIRQHSSWQIYVAVYDTPPDSADLGRSTL